MRKIRLELVQLIDFKINNPNEVQLCITNKQPRKLMMMAARACIGFTEQGGNNKGRFVELVQKTIDGVAKSEPWCMCFVQSMIAYAEYKTGIKSNLYTSESCMSTWRKTPALNRVKNIPAPGAIVIWQKEQSDFGHTGFVFDFRGDEMTTVEGNTGTDMRDGDGVYERLRTTKPEGKIHIVGYLIPFEK